MRQAGSIAEAEKKTGMNSLDKRLSLFESPEVKAKIAIS
jgi:hypothetical protein